MLHLGQPNACANRGIACSDCILICPNANATDARTSGFLLFKFSIRFSISSFWYIICPLLDNQIKTEKINIEITNILGYWFVFCP